MVKQKANDEANSCDKEKTRKALGGNMLTFDHHYLKMRQDYPTQAYSKIVPSNSYAENSHYNCPLYRKQCGQNQNTRDSCRTLITLEASSIHRRTCISTRTNGAYITFMTGRTVTVHASEACAEIQAFINNSNVPAGPPITRFHDDVF